MLHLENFFEKSFALLLTTPKLLIVTKKILKQNNICDILIIIELWKGQMRE